MLLSSPDHRGATGPMLYSITSTIEYVGEEEVTVQAGALDALHFRFVTNPELPEEHPPYDIWDINEGVNQLLKETFTGYMKTS